MALQNEVVPEDSGILFLTGQPIIGVNTNLFNSILKEIVEDLIEYYKSNPTIEVEKCWIDYCNNPTNITINTLIEELCKINSDIQI